MSWGYRLSIPESARAEGIDEIRGYNGRVINAGRHIPYLERKRGKARWETARYGLDMFNSGKRKMFWNAKRETLKTNEAWFRLIRMRVAIPVNAYVESAPHRNWLVGDQAWVPGLYNPSPTGGIVTITEPISDGGRPILLTTQAAIDWLDAEQWEAIATLDGERVKFSLADDFLSAKLDMELRSRAPIAA